MVDRNKEMSYSDAGVDIEAGNELVRRIKPSLKKTIRPGSASSIGGFGGLFDLKAAGFKDPILVSATDGVGTKLRIAIDTQNLDTVGIDLVAMCVCERLNMPRCYTTIFLGLFCYWKTRS